VDHRRCRHLPEARRLDQRGGAAAPTGAADAHDSLRTVLGYAGADIVEGACSRIPIERSLVGAQGMITDDAVRTEIAAVLRTLAVHAATARAA
jgi:chromate reductase, NAD(P)H dehydrogenase (quinone)